MEDIQIQNLTSEVYAFSGLAPEFIEQVAARVEELIMARKSEEQDKCEDTRIDQRALELD